MTSLTTRWVIPATPFIHCNSLPFSIHLASFVAGIFLCSIILSMLLPPSIFYKHFSIAFRCAFSFGVKKNPLAVSGS